jgi:hypothetical protein
MYSADGLSMSGNNPLTLTVGSTNSRLNTSPQMKAAAQASRDAGTGGEVPGGMGVGEQAAGVAKDIVGGSSDIYQGAKADFKASGGNPLANGGKSSSPEALRLQRGGAARLISGAGTAALALSAPQLLEIGVAAVAGDKAAQIGLAKVVAGAAAGTGASAAGGAVADKLNTTPETKALVQASMFFFPTVAGSLLGVAGFKGGAGVDGEGNVGAGVRSPGGNVRAGVRATPEAYEGGVQVGGAKVNVRIPRTPSPTEVIGNQVLDANVETMRQSAQADAAAALIVKGATPQEAVAAQQPKAPDLTPDEMRSGVLSPQMVDATAQIIKASPPEEQPNLMMQAAGALSGWIQKVKQFVGPDGKLASADTPQAADKLAQKILNDEVDRHDAVAEDAAKQAQEAAEAAQAPTPTASEGKGKSKLQQGTADRQYARAKTMIEASDSPEAAVAAMGRAQIPPEQAQQFIARHQQEQVAATTPTVGSAAEPVVEESRKTIDAQMDALKAGTIKVVMLPEGSNYRPATPPGMKVMEVKGDAPGAGRYIYDPTKLRAATIREAAKAGTHGDLMGHVSTKEDVAAAPQTVAVVAHKPDGTEIQTSEVPATPAHVQAQVVSMAERHPAAQVSIKPVDDVINDRLAAQQEEAKGDIFDQVAPEPEQVAVNPKSEGGEAEKPEQGTGVEKSAPATTPQELKSYEAEVSKYAGDPDPKKVSVQAENRRHAESLLREQHPKAVIGGVDRVEEHKYSFGSTQSDLPKGSDASKAIDVIRGKIDKADLAGDGIDIDENHVTVRYGIQGGDVDGIRAYLKTQAPFEAKLGATAMFEPNKAAILSGNEEPAAVIQTPVESAELHRMNEEIAKHGDFKESDFPDYKPHVTVAYVKPEVAQKYVGLDDAKGKTFRVDSVTISDRDGGKEVVKLEGKAETVPAKAPAPTAVGDRVKFKSLAGSEMTGTAKHVGKAVTRILGDDHKRYDVPHKNVLGAAEDESKQNISRTKSAEKDVSGGTDKDLKVDKKEVEKSPKDKISLAEHMTALVESGKMPHNNLALQGEMTRFLKAIPTRGQMKEAQEALEAAIVARARSILATQTSDRATFARLVDLYESQPNLNIRTTTSMTNQAYSTPAPLAFVASRLAGITKDTTVYEPTAGNGMLLIGATPKLTTANEIEPGRLTALKDQGFKVTDVDAINGGHHSLGAGKNFDAIITNPPFGSIKTELTGKTQKVKVDGYKIGQIDHLIAARALDYMKDDGKATIILGASKVTGGLSADDRIFFNWLYSHYNVTSHFEVDGSLYARQGANWPVRVINVDGRVRSDRFSPAEGSIQRVGTWKEVYERFNESLAAHGEGIAQPRPDGSVRGSGDASLDVRRSPAKTPVAVDRSGPPERKASADGLAGEQPRPLPDSELDAAAGLARTDDDVRPDADVARSNRLPEGAKREPAVKRDAKPSGAGGSDLTDPENAFQVKYTPASSKKDEGVLIPSNMRAPWEHAMRTLEDSVGDLDKFTAKQLGYSDADELHNALMGLQVDSVAAAIHQMGKGKAIIIADQTGIGKGRQAAAIIRWAIHNDKIPVFMTVKPSLFTDIYGDLADIGSDDVQPFIVNIDQAISLPNGTKVFGNKPGRHKSVLEGIRNSRSIPADRNAVFATYSQINTDNLQRQVLYAIADKAVFILDEAHTAAGDSGTGEFMQSLLGGADSVTYLSATYAKRPDNMPIYFKTDMGTAIKDASKLEEALAMGGLPLQTVISTNLVKAGQLARRERSYDGVDIATKVDSARKVEHTELADKVTTALRAIVKADKLFHSTFVRNAQLQAKAEGQAVSGGGNKASSTIAHAEFTSIVHNFVRQMVLALKADSAADDAIAAIKRGEKPLITVEQTMGTFLSAYATDNKIGDGDSLGNFDYRTVLKRALDRTRYIVKEDQRGNKTKHYISMNELDGVTHASYRAAEKVIEGLQMDLPMSPIDWIRHKITAAGHTIGEITGRSLSVDYTDPKKPTLSQVPAEERTDKVATTRKFNDGRLDAILLNVSGSTGISLHASEKFKDQRQRHMIVAQPAQDINVFMQMLGRIHRTGQVRLPRYTLLSVDLPAEIRPTALLSKKMKSLNANTSSNTESATSVKAPDMLNKYGDEIVARYLEDNPDLMATLGVTAMEGDHAKLDLARDVTGKLAITPVATQTAFYNEVAQSYTDYLDYLNATNQNDLEPRTFDYDAKEEKTRILSKGEDPTSPFGEDSVYGEYSIKAQSKPLTPEQVTASIKDSLGGKTPAAFTQTIVDTLDPQLAAWQATLDPESPMRSQSNVVKNTAVEFLRNHQIGQTLRLDIASDIFSVAVTNVENTHKGGGNPFALSKFVVTLATTGATPSIKIPATQLNRVRLSWINEPAAGLFEIRTSQSREIAKIITGNLLAAYGELKDTRGTIINFTKADGAMEVGILLPKKFNLVENTMGDYLMKSPAHVANYLMTTKSEDAKTIGVSSRDGNARIVNRKGELVIVTPKAKASGGKYFLDKKLTGITGDFISSGTSMRVVVPHGKEIAAITELMKKVGLYVPKSMAEGAADLEPKKGDAPPAKTSSSTPGLRSSLFGVDVLAEAVAKSVKVTWDKDVAPHLPAIGANIKEVSLSTSHLLVPTAGANADVLDAMMRLKGDQEKARFAVEQMFKGVSKMWDGLPEVERIAFLDNYKTGKAQVAPELDKLVTLYKTVDSSTYRSIVDAQIGGMDRATRKVWDSLNVGEKADFFDKVMDGRDIALANDQDAANKGDRSARLRLKLQSIADHTLTFKADHFRSFWKVVPGSGEERMPDRTKRGPLRGDRGMLKRSTLPDVTTGMDRGGVLVTTNPQKLFEMAQSSSLRYITALNMWKELGDLGMRKFVALGDRAPEGWVPVNDSIAKVYFPVDALTMPKAALPDVVAKDDLRTRKTMIHTGDWYLEPSAGRLLNNYLSKSWFQENAVGRGLMAVKNLSTAVELSLSPFHLVFETLEAMGSQFGLGMMHMLNVGVGQGDLRGFLEGAKVAATSPAAPFTMARTGGSAIRATADFDNFAKTPRGQSFLRAFPDATHLIDLAFTGGLTMGMPADYRTNLMESARSAMTDGNYFGALVRAVPGVIQTIMNPLFETYIPRLKMGFFLQAMSQQMAEKHDALASGEMSEAELARQVVNSTENRFGELNFSNLWLDNTFKGATQLLFRSVTWKLGNWRGLTAGVAGQAKAFADPLKTMYEDVKGERKGADRKAGEYVPKLDLNMSWLLGMAMTTAVVGTILSKLMGGKYPWEYLEADRENGMSAAGALALELAHPRTGGVDGFTGKPTRLSLPTGLRDFEHGTTDPRGYLRGSESGFIGKSLDTWDNRDFFGNYVYDPNGTNYQKLAEILSYNKPLPISVQSFQQGKKSGDFTRFKMGMVGLSLAPKDLDLTPLEKHMEGVVKAKHEPETPQQRADYQAKMQGIRDGSIRGPERDRALKTAREPYLLRMFGKLSYIEAKSAYLNYATPEEQHILRGALATKLKNALRRNPSTTRAAEHAVE